MKNGTVALLVIGALLLLGGGGVAVYTMTRGLRNNNPGNIRKSNDNWAGLAPEQPDTAFFTFISPEYGIRALARVLLNYLNKYGLTTVRQIVTRWAPPTENDTEAYIADVSRRLNVSPDDDVSTRLYDLVTAIIHHENGIQPYDSHTIANGVQMAYA